MKVISGLKYLFIIYFIIKMAFDVYLVSINRNAFGDLADYGYTGVTITPQTMMILIIAVNIILFLIGLWLFTNLENTKNWSRVILIIIGWIAVISFFTSIFLGTQTVEVLKDSRLTVSWERIILTDHITDFLGLVYWGYLIIMLQFNMKIRHMFN